MSQMTIAATEKLYLIKYHRFDYGDSNKKMEKKNYQLQTDSKFTVCNKVEIKICFVAEC